jgi:hypothetical protein
MIAVNRHLRIAPLATWLRRSLVVAAVVLAAQSAQAGMMTSMSAADEATISHSSDHSRHGEPRSVLFELRSDVQKALAQQPGGNSTSTSTTSIPSGSGQSVFTSARDSQLDGMQCCGWIVPEAVQALPPLLPSGLFRPPCA